MDAILTSLFTILVKVQSLATPNSTGWREMVRICFRRLVLSRPMTYAMRCEGRDHRETETTPIVLSDVAPRSVWLLSLRKEVLLAHKNHRE